MTSAVLFDDTKRSQFYPLAQTRPVGAIRAGIRTISEQWQAALAGKIDLNSPPTTNISFKTDAYLQDLFPHDASAQLHINARVLPTAELVLAIEALREGQALQAGGDILAAKSKPGASENENFYHFSSFSNWEIVAFENPFILEDITDLFIKAGELFELDFKNFTAHKTSTPLHPSNTILGTGQVFLEEGAQAHCAIFNTSAGDIFLGKNAEVMEGSIVRGPFALGEGAVLKMGAKIYGPTLIGPQCRIGGEVSNSVFQGFSNKGHDGFVGNSVVGEWCNLGADTNTSNLKNNYGRVKRYNFTSKKMEQTTLTFCGLLMGDYSKCGINTMFNTATTVGVCANIFDSGFPPKYVADFSWGINDRYDLNKAFETAEAMCVRRKVTFSDKHKGILRHIFDSSSE